MLLLSDGQYYPKEYVFAGIKEDKAADPDVPVWFTKKQWDWVKMAYQYINGTVSDSKLLAQITKKYNQLLTALRTTQDGYDSTAYTKNIDSVMHYVLEQFRNFDQNQAKNDVCNVDPS